MKTGAEMKTRTVMLTLVMCFVGLTLCFAENPMIGTWKLNEAKSQLSSGSEKNSTVVYEVAGDSIKCAIDGVDGQGKPLHIEWTGKFDGKDYPLTGDPTAWRELPKRTAKLLAAVASLSLPMAKAAPSLQI